MQNLTKKKRHLPLLYRAAFAFGYKPLLLEQHEWTPEHKRLMKLYLNLTGKLQKKKKIIKKSRAKTRTIWHQISVS